MIQDSISKFYVLLTVHPDIIV